MERPAPRRRWPRLLAIAVLVPAVVVAAFGFYLAQEANVLPWQEEPTAIADTITPFAELAAVSASTPADLGAQSASPSPVPAAVGSEARAFVIDPERSEARYVVKETVGRLKMPTEAVGKTRAIRGQIVLDDEGRPLDGSRIEVDLRTLKSGVGERDNFIQTITLKDAPVATFEITGVQGWNPSLADGLEHRIKIVGQMTIGGTTKELTFDGTAVRQGDALSGTATTVFTWSDFGLKKPSLAVQLISVEDEVRLELTVVASA